MSVMVVIAARDEAERVGDTVRAARSLVEVDDVVVVDDGSTDGTATVASSAGARVLVAPRNLGKGRALEAALDLLEPSEVYLLLDADLGPTAKEAAGLLRPLLDDEADVAIGALPRDPRHGGFRVVKHLSGWMIRRLSGFRAEEPMSGQRAVTRAALQAARPLAPGFGTELGMTVDVVRAGFRVVEVPVAMSHAPTGRTARGFAHRARQGRDHLRAALARLRNR